LRLASIELLVTSQYLDEWSELYATAEECYSLGNTVNTWIDEWVRSSRKAEDWLLMYLTEMIQRFMDLSGEAAVAQERLKRII
jgi:hypothetical protein